MADKEFIPNTKPAKPDVKKLDDKKKNKFIQIAGLGQNGNNDEGNEGVYINSDFYRNDVVGKPYPGRVNYNTQRVLAYNSTVVRAILTLRSHQIAKLPIKLIAANEEEPPRQMSILDYNIYQIENHPAFDDAEKTFLTKIYYRLDPDAYIVNKKKVLDDNPDMLTSGEQITISHLQEKHDTFYRKRQSDKTKIMNILRNPDPWFTNITSWESFAKSFLMDMLVIDRGAIVKLRDASGNLKGLMPVDGACYSNDTEVLTENGWKFFVDVDLDKDRFATRNQDSKEFEWQKATYFHEADYDGPMYHFKSRTVDIMVSENHRMLIHDTNSKKGKEFVVTAKEAYELWKNSRKGTFAIPAQSSWQGVALDDKIFNKDVKHGNPPAEVFMTGDQYAKFMGAYLSEGSLSHNKSVVISQKRFSKGFQEFELLLKEICEQNNLYYKYDETNFYINNSALANYLSKFGRSFEKFVPEDIKNATSEQIKLFLRFFALGDGTYDANRVRYFTSSKQLSDDLQELIQKSGKSASIRERLQDKIVTMKSGRDILPENCKVNYVVSERSSKVQRFTVEKIEGTSDTVRCVSVPNEFLYVRRNGQPAWCGNTVRPVLNKFGTFHDEYAYVQVVHGSPHVYLKKDDVIVMTMNPMTDMKYFGYGLSNMETLYTAVLSDIFIDKGNLDFYRKGGSIPEGFVSIEPPPSREGMIQQIDQEQLESIQRHLQSIMMGDYTQVPIVSGGRISWIDLKGKRRDMQFKELAEYLTRKICAVYQVSPQDVGVVSDVNRSTAAVQAEMTRSKGLRTLMGVISQYITSHVIDEIRPEKDLRLWFDDDDVELRRTQWTMEQQQLVSGAITINQWRASQGMHPVPWGNTPLQGLRNWQPEEEEAGAGGIPGLPPLPQGLAPGMMNPGGAVGGANPMSGAAAQAAQSAPPIGSMMKSKYFGFNKTQETPDDLMIKHFAGMYEDNAKFSEILDYPGGEAIRKSVDSYEYFVNSRPSLGATVIKSVDDYDPSDPLVFSRYLGNGIIELNEEGGDIPVFKAISLAAFDNINEDRMENLRVNLNTDDESQIRDAVEWAVFKSLDEGLKNSLYENFYKFQDQPFSDALIERVGEILEL